MKDRVTVLHQALNHLEVDPGNGHAVQKAVYLAQAAGAPMGYKFAWYPRGPHSCALAGSIYDMQMAVEDMEERPERELIEPVKESVEGVRPCLNVPHDVDLDCRRLAGAAGLLPLPGRRVGVRAGCGPPASARSEARPGGISAPG